MLVATIVNLVLVFIGFIFKPGGSGVGWEFGAFIGLIAAVVAAAPYAIPQLRARRWAEAPSADCYCRIAASSNPGIRAADGSASKATNRRMTS